MDDTQLKNMVDMMKNNKEYMRQMYRAQGMEMSDEQLDNLAQMMNPDMIKQASQMLSSNPDLINQVPNAGGLPNSKAPQSSPLSQEEVKTTTLPTGMPAMPNGMGNMAEMMNSPMVQ